MSAMDAYVLHELGDCEPGCRHCAAEWADLRAEVDRADLAASRVAGQVLRALGEARPEVPS